MTATVEIALDDLSGDLADALAYWRTLGGEDHACTVIVRRTTSGRSDGITLRSGLSVMPGQQCINTINFMVGNSIERIR